MKTHNLLLELKDFYNMLMRNLPIAVKWKELKSMNYIDGGTVWQRCEQIQPADKNVIGEYRPTTYTILQTINELKGEFFFTNTGLQEFVRKADKQKSFRALLATEKDAYPFALYLDGVRYGYQGKDDMTRDFNTLKVALPNLEIQ